MKECFKFIKKLQRKQKMYQFKLFHFIQINFRYWEKRSKFHYKYLYKV